MSGAPIVHLQAPRLRCGAAICQCESYAEAANCEHARVLAPAERATLVHLLSELVEQHENGVAGISPACIERAKAALAREGVR
jgi:hypothetical protein